MSKLSRITDADLPIALSLLAQAGATVRTKDTWAHDHMTALALGNPPAAVMPLSHRHLQPAQGRSLAAGWLSSNQFASKISLRSATKNTAPEWPNLLPELDLLTVTRRDESSWGLAGPTRWYRHTGFEDVLSIRCLYLDMDAPPTGPRPTSQVQIATPTDPSWEAAKPQWEQEMYQLHRDVYGSYGGLPRSPSFWTPTLLHHYYRDHYQFQIIGLWNASGGLTGYAVVGWSGWHSKRPRMDILELATRQWDTASAAELILTTCQLAWSKNVHQLRAVISAHDPYRGHLTRTGFQDRWGYSLMAKWLNAQRTLDRLAPTLPKELGDLALEFVSPGSVPLTLRRGNPSTTIRLQGNNATITRLLLNRLDIAAALQEGTLLPAEALSESDLARVSLAFPWTPWAFHMLDYI